MLRRCEIGTPTPRRGLLWLCDYCIILRNSPHLSAVSVELWRMSVLVSRYG